MMDFLAPSCFVCGKIVPIEGRKPAGRTCKSCRGATAIYAFFSPFSYQEPLIRTLIHDLKYKRVRVLASLFGELLSAYLRYYRVDLPKYAVIVPIPLHAQRARFRGFNQSMLVAKNLAQHVSRGLEENALVKIKKTKPQVGLFAGNRRANIRGSFAASSLIKGKTVILFDDVKTTGATIEEAARVLKEAGAKWVWAVTFAH